MGIGFGGWSLVLGMQGLMAHQKECGKQTVSIRGKANAANIHRCVVWGCGVACGLGEGSLETGLRGGVGLGK